MLSKTLRLMLVIDRNTAKPKTITQLLTETLAHGVSCVQLREKDISTKEFYNLALKVKEICQKYNKPLIINDRLDVALAINADGLHLGQSDLPCKIAKKLFPNKIIGISVSNFTEAKIALEDGADYLGVGAIFPTDSKKEAKLVTPDDLLKIISLKIPIVLIGGINVNNAKQLWPLGIDGLAVISAISKAENPINAVKLLLGD